MNNQNISDEDIRNQESEKKRKIREIEREILMLEGDRKKIIEEKYRIEIRIRELSKEEDRIRVEIRDCQEKIKALELEIMRLDNDIKSQKKKMNML